MNSRSALSAIAFMALFAAPAFAQDEPKTLAAKGGETIDLIPVYGEHKCQSTLAAPPEVEVLQGPPEVKLSVREDMVTPRNCPAKIKGGFVVATIAALTKPVEGKLTFRVKYKVKDGTTRLVGHAFNVSLVP